MRTTVDVPEHLLIEAKKLAASSRSSVSRIVEESLRAFLAQKGASPPGEPSALPIVRGVRLVRGVDLDDTSALLDLE